MRDALAVCIGLSVFVAIGLFFRYEQNIADFLMSLLLWVCLLGVVFLMARGCGYFILGQVR